MLDVDVLRDSSIDTWTMKVYQLLLARLQNSAGLVSYRLHEFDLPRGYQEVLLPQYEVSTLLRTWL